jgi:membrane-bound lytic murein transglycosylase D
MQLIFHTVKAGENLNTIASLYGVTAQNLRNWNNLSGTRVTQGRRIRVSVDNGGITFGEKYTTPPSTNFAQVLDRYTYQVQEGDTLSGIAKKYPGVTWQSIQQANGMTTTNLRIGQILKIP